MSYPSFVSILVIYFLLPQVQVQILDHHDYKILVSTGLYLRPPLRKPVISSQHTKLLFSYSLRWLPSASYFSTHTYSNCDHLEDSQKSLCQLYHESETNMNYISKFIDQSFMSLSMAAPSYVDNIVRIGTFTPRTATTSTTTTPSPSSSPSPSMQSSEEETANSNINTYSQIGRKKRQLVVGGIALGALGYQVYEYFKGEPDSQEVYDKLVEGLRIENKNMIQQSVRINTLSRATKTYMVDISRRIQGLVNQTKADKVALERQYNSLAWGETRTALTTAHIAQDINRGYDLFIYQSILSDCRNKRIPILAVSPMTLKHELKRLKVALVAEDHELVISEELISTYFHLPLASCRIGARSITNTIEINVILDIPIQRKGQEANLYQAIAVPFLHENRTCRLNVPYHTIITRDNNIYIIDGSQAHTCNFENEYCTFSEYSSEHSYSTECIRSLIKGKPIDKLKRVCNFICSEDKTTHITEIETNHYSVINPHAGLIMSCFDSKNWKSKPIGQSTLGKLGQVPGAWTIQLPCNCKVHDENNNMLIEPSYLCVKANNYQAPIVRLLIPYIWTNITEDTWIRSAVINTSSTTGHQYDRLEDIINWEAINKTEEDFKPIDFSSIEDSIHKHLLTWNSFYSDSLMVLWNIIISIILFYTYCKMNFTSSPFLYEFLRRAPPAHALSLEEVSRRHFLFLIIIIFLNLFILWCFILVLYFYCRRKWTRNGIGCMFFGGNTNQREEAYHPLQALGPDQNQNQNNIYPSLSPSAPSSSLMIKKKSFES